SSELASYKTSKGAIQFPINHAITVTFGVAGLKYAADLLGYKGGFVRSPLQPLADAQKQAIRDLLIKSNFL
ncbi:MAG: 4-hydroxy-tetrahydrodipicolinate synthase, partial [Bacteroidota bacterium]